MILGSAVPTMVWSIAASSAASSRPVKVPTSCGRVSRTIPDVWNSVSAVAVTATSFDFGLGLGYPECGADHSASARSVDQRQRMQQRRSQPKRSEPHALVDVAEGERRAPHRNDEDAGRD